MFKKNEIENQLTFTDSTTWMNPRVREKLKNSWAPVFYEEVFCQIDEEPFRVLYSDMGRPNFPVNILLSLEFIKELFGYTDDELIENYYFNYLINYAVGIRTLGDRNLAERTLYEFRSRVYQYTKDNPEENDLIFDQFKILTDNFKGKGNVDTTMLRADSTMVVSNIKILGRLQLAYDVLVKGLKIFDANELSKELKDALTPKFKTNLLYKIKKQEISSKFEYVLSLMLKTLKFSIENHRSETEGIVILKRFLDEQTNYDMSSDVITLKASMKDMKGDILQSAHDQDATCRTKNGIVNRGYSLNLFETCNKENETQLITDYHLDKNIKSDVAVLEDRIETVEENTECKDLYMDGGYYNPESEDKHEKINFHYTSVTGKNPTGEKLPIYEFTFEKIKKNNKWKFKVITCPNNLKPNKVENNEKTVSAYFSKDKCNNCMLKPYCHIREQKGWYVAVIKYTQIKASLHRLEIKKNGPTLISHRAAIEGTNSALKRKYGIGKLKVRRLHKCRVVTGFKIVAYNFNQFLNIVRNQRKKGGFVSVFG